MSGSRWLRLNTDWHLSDWLVVLSAESRLAWVQLLCHVKINGFAGRCKAIAPIVAERLWFVNEPSIRQMLQAAENAGAIVITDGTWEVAKWRQYQGDESNAERQKRYRERQSQVQSGQKVTGRNVLRNEVTPTETETETETKRKTNKKKFTPPSLTEVQRYAREREDCLSGCEPFWNFYESKGWKVGKEPMKDWQAAWRGWVSRTRINSKPSSGVDWEAIERNAREVLGA